MHFTIVVFRDKLRQLMKVWGRQFVKDAVGVRTKPIMVILNGPSNAPNCFRRQKKKIIGGGMGV